MLSNGLLRFLIFKNTSFTIFGERLSEDRYTNDASEILYERLETPRQVKKLDSRSQFIFGIELKV